MSQSKMYTKVVIFLRIIGKREFSAEDITDEIAKKIGYKNKASMSGVFTRLAKKGRFLGLKKYNGKNHYIVEDSVWYDAFPKQKETVQKIVDTGEALHKIIVTEETLEKVPLELVENALVGKKLFDENGRRIFAGWKPPEIPINIPNNLRYGFSKLKTNISYSARLRRLSECLGLDLEINGEEFEKQVEFLLTQIRANPQISNILNGVWLPIFLPQTFSRNLKEVSFQKYFEPIKKSYLKTFKDGYFMSSGIISYPQRTLIAEESRYDQLVTKLEFTSIVGIIFLNSLQEFSVKMARNQMRYLPEEFILSGIDTLIAMIMYPDILFKNKLVLGIHLAAFSLKTFISGKFSSVIYPIIFDDWISFTNGFCERYHSSNGLLYVE